MRSQEVQLGGYPLHKRPSHVTTTLQAVFAHSTGKLSQIPFKVVDSLGIRQTIRLGLVLFILDGKAVFCNEQRDTAGLKIAFLYIVEHLAKSPRHVKQKEWLSWITDRLASHRVVMRIVCVTEEVFEWIRSVIGRGVWQSPGSRVAVQTETIEADT
jgi:hypothetical protein